MCTRAVTRISKHLRFSHYSNSFAVSASSTETQSTTRLSRAPFLTSFALPSSLGDASAERCGYTAKISSPRQTSGVRSRACRGTSFPRIQSFSFTRLECPGRNASPGCRNRSCNAHLSGRFANRTPSSVLSMDVEFSQDVRTNQPGGCVMETPRPASTMTPFPTARASASPSPSFAPDVCFPSFALKSRRGFLQPTLGYRRYAVPNLRVFAIPIPARRRCSRQRSRARRVVRTSCAGRGTPCPPRRNQKHTCEVGPLAQAWEAWTKNRDQFHLARDTTYRKENPKPLDHRRAPGMRKAFRQAVREGARSAQSTLQRETQHRLCRRVREAKGSTRRARDSGGTSAMRYWDLHAMFPRETRETRRVRVSGTTKAGDRKRPRGRMPAMRDM